MILTREQILALNCNGLQQLQRHSTRSFEGEGFAAAVPDRRGLAAEPHVEVSLEEVIENFNPSLLSIAGMDLRVGEVYRANSLIRLNSAEDLSKLVQKGTFQQVKPDSQGKIRLRHDVSGNVIYVVASHEKIKLPSHLDLKVDSRSSTGRLAVLSDYISSKVLNSGSRSPVIVSVRPYAFDIIVTPGQSQLFQANLRIRNSAFMSQDEVSNDAKNIGLLQGDSELALKDHLTKEGLLMTYSTQRAFVARRHVEDAIDVDARNCYGTNDFFEEVGGNHQLDMQPRRFYLLGTREAIRLGNVAGILTRDSPDTGTGLWGHFAGIIQPGYQGRITMECRSESPCTILDGDPAGFVAFDKLSRELRSGEGYHGKYQNHDAPKLPGQFKK